MLHLNYAIDKDISDHEQKLSEDGKKRIREIAEELSTQSIIEQQSNCPLYIYGFNPNKAYTLIHGKRSADLLSFELITDGDISSISYKKDDKNYYEDTNYPNRYVVLKDNDVANLKLKNASYSIKQGLCNDKICYSIVNTKITNLETLEQIMNIANNRYEDYNLTNKAPYVKKIVLK